MSTLDSGLRVSIVTLFPELFASFLETSMVGRARSLGVLRSEIVALREFGLGKHKNVDDTPYGGGSGMVLRVEPVADALDAADARAELAGEGKAHRVLLSPQGRPFQQAMAHAFAEKRHIALVCGRYEGFDERVKTLVHEEISLGDFVLTGGEVAAMAIVEASSRLLPGVLGNENSTFAESFSDALQGGLEYPQYTRPAEYRGLGIPEVLLSGNHAAIEAYRKAEVLSRTRERRPDLRPSAAQRPVHVALVHHPVLDREGNVITTTLTNLDLHDIARSLRTFGAGTFFIAHPIAAQRELAERIIGHWTRGSGKRRIPDRAPALDNVRIVETLDAALEAAGPGAELWTTAAQARGGEIHSHAALRQELSRPGPPVVLVLGTGWGLVPSVLERADRRVAPIHGSGDYNHLSVRAACAILLSRLLA